MIRKIRKLIENNSDFLILSHREPDGDSVGSVVALYLALRLFSEKKVTAYYPVDFPERLKFLIEGIEIKDALEKTNFDAVFVLDCSSPDRIAGVSNELLDRNLTINVDHHIYNTLFGDINWVDPQRSSVGEMIYSLFSSVKLPVLALEGIYTSLLTDTGKFTYQSVSAQTFSVASRLVRLGVDPYKIASRLYFNYPHGFLNQLGNSFVNAERLMDGKVIFIDVDTRLAKLGYELETIIELAMIEKEIKVGALFIPLDERTKVSLRSKDKLDVGEIASSFGGGGHRNASGCVIKLPLEKSKKIILDEISKRKF